MNQRGKKDEDNCLNQLAISIMEDSCKIQCGLSLMVPYMGQFIHVLKDEIKKMLHATSTIFDGLYFSFLILEIMTHFIYF